MSTINGKPGEEWMTSLEDEQCLRDKIYELYKELNKLQSQPIRTEEEQARYEQVKNEYTKSYREYEKKYSYVMEADLQKKAEEKTPKPKNRLKALIIGLIVLVAFVSFVIIYYATVNYEGTAVVDGKLVNYYKWDGPETVIGDGYKIAEEDGDDGKTIVLAEDKRVPDLKTAQNTDQYPERRHFTWTARDGSTVLNWNPQIYKETFEAYRNADRYLESNEFEHYMSDSNNERLLLEISHTLESIGEGMGYSDWELVNEAINFVQNIEYVEDIDSTGHEEWPKYVTETVYDECGDCEDKAIFLAGILKTMGYDVVLVAFDGHLGVGISCEDDLYGTNYEINDKKYYYIEPSYPGWEIGQLPDTVDTGQIAIIPVR